MLGFLRKAKPQPARPELIAPACAASASEVVAIKQTYLKRNSPDNPNIEAKVRLVTDDFVVGFALGLAFRYLFERGVQTPSNSKYVILPTLQELLVPQFLGIDVVARHESGTVPMNAGIFFGLQESPNNRRALRLVWESTNSNKLTPETSLMQYAFEDGANIEFGHLAKTAILEIKQRCNSLS